MAGAKNHDYHILPPSVWPLVGSMSALIMAVGGIMWMHGGHIDKPNGGGWIFFIGLAGLLFTFYSWWAQVIKEAHAGDHTPVVQLHFRYGMILFIASEVMFFVGWFWAFFDFSLFPTAMTYADGSVTRAVEGGAAMIAAAQRCFLAASRTRASNAGLLIGALSSWNGLSSALTYASPVQSVRRRTTRYVHRPSMRPRTRKRAAAVRANAHVAWRKRRIGSSALTSCSSIILTPGRSALPLATTAHHQA